MNDKPQSTALAGWQEFESELQQRADEIASLLPPNVDKNRYLASAIAAIKQNPELLKCTKRSLFTSITKSAQDGLLPDGREGVITPYNVNIAKKNEPDRWESQAQWNPMVFGLRKRARELDKILIDAQVIYALDKFEWVQGDAPRILHVPGILGTDRGEMIGAYAIIKREDGTILHREVMSAPEIQTVREQAKAKNSLMWTTFRTEGYRKTVVRRGIKSVPVSSDMTAIIQRDDEEHFDFEKVGVLDDQSGAFIPPRPQRSEFERLEKTEGVTIDATVRREPETVGRGDDRATVHHEAETVAVDLKAQMRAQQAGWFEQMKQELLKIEKVRDVSPFADAVEDQLFPEQIREWQKLCDDHQRALINKLAKPK